MNPPAKPKVQFREYARFLKRYLSPRMNLVIALGAALFTNIGLQIYNPQIMRTFIDQAMAGGEAMLLSRLALTFIGIAVAQQLIGVLVTWVTENLGWATTNQLRLELARYTLGLDMSFHAAHTPGEMIERIDGDVMALSNFFSQFILQVFGNILLVLGVLVVLTFEDWHIGAALGAFVVITVFVLLKLANISVGSWEEERKASADLYGFLEERLSGTEDIRSNNAKNYVLDRFYRLTRTLMRKTITAGIKMNVLMNTTWLLFAVGNAITLLVTAALYRSEAITLGTVFMVIYYSNMLNWPLERITQQMQDLQRAGASLIRIMGIQKITGKIPGEENFVAPGRAVLQPGALSVRFDRVTFSYQDSVAILGAAQPEVTPPTGTNPDGGTPEPAVVKEKEVVLHDISLHLAQRRVLGLLGRTGSGKTTLTRLLFRLYDPEQGAIHLGCGDEGNGTDCREWELRQVPIQELRRRIGMVTQNIQLFHATVRENLTFFDPSIPDEKIKDAIHNLGLAHWFDSLSNGLDTELESGGGGLSAGEAQLLAFTRIFLREPGLVILDEATSRLDPATEFLIEQAVDKLVRDRTAIIVAHRLGTVQRADDILILEDGRILEYGARAELAQDPASRFYHLLETGLEEVLV
jgi:ATP-binding cassette, subfamily B, bacterial